ncbi:MFS transporter [Aurantivibrio infirmus]
MSSENIEANPAKEAPKEEIPYPKESYAWYVVGVLMVVYVFSFMDRQILNLLIDPIKADLNVTDTQMSYLGGLAFAVFYTFFGIPIGRMADSKNRKVIITIGLASWSFFTMLCGAATRYTYFALARMGVGVGEATLSPSAYSLITDMFQPKRIALAISIYAAGIYIGSGLSSIFGGIIIGWAENAGQLTLPIIGDVKPWQFVFFAIGFPGLVFTLVMLTVKEPLRRESRAASREKPVTSVPFLQVFSYIGRNWKTFVYHNVGFGFCSFISYGASYWIPSFLIRVHEQTRFEAGVYYGSIVAICGTCGIIFGGWLAGRLQEKGYADSKMRVGLIAAIAHIPCGLLYPLMPTPELVYLILCPSVFTVAMPFGVAPAAIQEMMPNRMRAQASSVYLFILNIIGLGLGPSAVAWCTDLYYKDTQMVGMSLLWVSTLFGLISCVLLYLGMRHFRTSMQNLEDWNNGIEVKQYTAKQMYTFLTLFSTFILATVGWLLFG